MKRSQFFYPAMLGAVLLIIAIAACWFIFVETPDRAAQELKGQGLDATAENFIKEIQAGHTGNVKAFIAVGMNAGAQDEKHVSALLAAAQGQDKETLGIVLKSLPSDKSDARAIVNLQDDSGTTALMAAVKQNNTTLVDQLLGYGADPTLANNSQETPLVVAIKSHNEAFVPTLIAADRKMHGSMLSVSTPDSSADTPLTHAIKQQLPDTVKKLLDAGADGSWADPRGDMPMMAVAEVGNEPIAEILMEKGAKLDVANRFGETPLTIAVRHGHPAFAKFLMEKGASPDFNTKGILPLEVIMETEPFDADLFGYALTHSKEINSIASDLLFKAADTKHPELVKILLDRGLDPKVTNARGETLFYHSIEAGLEDVALLLIDKGVDISRTGVTGATALQSAVQHNEVKLTKKLLEKGISPDQRTQEGYTIAEMAIYRGYPEILEALLDKGAKLPEKGFTILWSIRDGGGRAVPVLLAHGAMPNIMSDDGNPALWLAASAGEAEAVRALIDHHAPIDYPNKAQGLTALGIAAHAGQLPVVKMLVEAGANIEATDVAGMTPLAQAAYMTKPDVAEYLISKGANVRATDSQGRAIGDLVGQASPSEARDKVMSLLQK